MRLKLCRHLAVSLAFLSALVAFGCGESRDADNAVSNTLSVSGIIDDGERNGTHIWFRFDGSDQRFVFDMSTEKEAETVFAALKESANAERRIVVLFEMESAYIDDELFQPTYFVRQITDREQIIARAGKGELESEPNEPGKALLRGIAFYEMGKLAEARVELDKALKSSSFDINWQVLAFRTRGRALSEEILRAQVDPSRNDNDDRQLVQALGDMKWWASFDPDDADAVRETATILVALGAYDEALAEYQRAAVRWPEDRYLWMVRIGAVYRLQGRFDLSLQALDDLVKASGPQEGMRFHYHRGWTLNELHRYEEAEKEFALGLQAQPDYAWAFVRRACALAQLGRVEDSLSAQTDAIKFLRDYVTASDSEADKRNLTHAEKILQELGREFAGGKKTSASPCGSYPVYQGERMRTRSRWLPQESV